MTTQALNKIRSTAEITADDLRLLQTLSLAETPELEPDKVVSAGEAPMVMTPTKSAGYINLRRNSDGQIKSINKNQLAERLKQHLDDGRPAWLSPAEPWARKGTVVALKCLLHERHAGRAAMDALGLPYCRKANIPSAAALRRHMMKKHKDFWDSIQRAEEQTRQDKRDATQERMAEALTAALTGGRVAAPVAVKAEPVPVSQECAVCHTVIEANGKLGLSSKVKAHMKQHPAAQAA